jgi:hypothetical protein
MSFKLINVSKFIINFLSVRKGDVTMYADAAAKHLGIINGDFLWSSLHYMVCDK